MGAVLMLALVITVYAEIARTEVPKWGAQAERDWSGEVQASMVDLASAAAGGVGAGTPVTGSLPLSSDPQGIDVPLLGGLKPLLPGGSVAFDVACASFDADHTGSAGSVVDVDDAARGCLVFRGDTVYASPFVFQTELGGVLRVQGDEAVVISGPPLELTATSPASYRVGLGLASLRGLAMTTSSAGSVRVDLAPGATSLASGALPNAGAADWGLDTRYPEAWRQWFERAFESAGFIASRSAPLPGESASDYDVACVPLDCSRGPDGLGHVAIRIDGARTDADDLVLTITHGVYDVSLR